MSVPNTSHGTVARPNVLIVDDHDLVAMSLVLALRAQGMTAQRHAARTRDGIVIAAATLTPGVVLLDLDLGREPGGAPIDGASLVDRFRHYGWQVVVLTATADEIRIGRALDAGALAYVSKTAQLPVLVTTVRRAARGVPAMHPDLRHRLIEQYHRRREQARAVESRLDRLSERERAVLEHLAAGRRAQAIAEEFGVTLATTRTQIRAVLQKLNVSGQLEAVALLHDYRRTVDEG
jgi:DNA-binding NarL/FixJ family response regulator